MTIPVRQKRRNLAVIIEVAAMNNREKTMGYNAAKDLMEHMGMDPDIMQAARKEDRFGKFNFCIPWRRL